MMAFVMRIGSTDISRYIAASGFEWERNDIDAPNSGRDKSGTMRRKRVVSKDKINVKCRTLNGQELAALAALLDHETVSVTYLRPATASTRTATFYGSTIKSATVQDLGSVVNYENVAFSLIEV